MTPGDVNDLAEERKAVAAKAPALLAFGIGLLVAGSLVTAAVAGICLHSSAGYYATMAQVLVTALLVLAFERRFLAPPVDMQSRVAVMISEHAGDLYLRFVVLMPTLGLVASCGALALNHPPSWVGSIATVLSLSSIATVMTYVAASAHATVRRSR